MLVGICVTGSILEAMTRSWFVTIVPWPRGKREKTCIVLVGGELRFLKLGLDFICQFFLKANAVKLLSEVNCEFCPVDWN